MIQDKFNSQLNIFLVGGAVRDQLLGLTSKDQDYLVIGATRAQMLALGFLPVGKDFPVFLHPTTKQEYALARTERKQGTGYAGFACYAEPSVTIEQDLQRRDLTINAMAMSANGTIIDPFNGQQDLKHKILRHVSPAFAEDPLRVLRVARFAARFHNLGFHIAPPTMALMSQISVSGELAHLSAERIWLEMSKALKEPHPSIFFQVLRQCHALSLLWPELDCLWGVPNPELWHPEICTGVHTMMVLQQACLLSSKLSVRFAALCHDLGKGLTEPEYYPSHKGHELAGLALVENICQQLKVPNDIKWLALKVCQYHLHCHKAFQLTAKTMLAMFNHLDIWRKPEAYQDFLLACQADFLGRLGFEQRPYPQKAFLQATARAALKVSAAPFVAQGMTGTNIKHALHDARIFAIKSVIEQYRVETEKPS
jgi:tRNA nucleotidyltransferase (CCA-adding enzyme)